MDDFQTSEAGKHAAYAKQILEGAMTLDMAQQEKGRILFLPTLMLAGQGFELLLKACIYLNGKKPPTRGKKGHGVLDLWHSDTCEPARGHVYLNSIFVLEELRADDSYIEDIKGISDLDLIDELVTALGELHGAQGYPLRYPPSIDQMAPRTPLLVRSLWRTADDFIKRPRDFELAIFLGPYGTGQKLRNELQKLPDR